MNPQVPDMTTRAFSLIADVVAAAVAEDRYRMEQAIADADLAVLKYAFAIAASQLALHGTAEHGDEYVDRLRLAVLEWSVRDDDQP